MNPRDPREGVFPSVARPMTVNGPPIPGLSLKALNDRQALAAAAAFLPLAVHRGLEYLSIQLEVQPWNMVALHVLPPLAMLAASVALWRIIPPLPGPPAGERVAAHRGLCIAAGLLMGALAAAANLLSMLATKAPRAAAGMLDPGTTALVAHVMILAPVAEEVAFRGIIYRHLRQFMLPLMATVSSALVFALMHGNLSQAMWAMVLGLVAAFAYEQTRSLVTPILIHTLFNSVPVGVAVARSNPGDVGPIWLVLFAVAVIFTFAARSASQGEQHTGFTL